MSKLTERMLRARESGVPVAGRTYTIRRPSDADAIEMSGLTTLDILKRFVVGWDLTELDLLPGSGTAEPVPFDVEAWAVHIADHPELWVPLGNAILEAFDRHIKARGEAEKN